MARSKGRGSITRLEDKPKSRCRSWKLRVRVDGRERSRRFHGTYSQAEAALDSFIAELSSPSTDMTFSEWAEAWEAGRSGDGLATQTLSKEQTVVNRLESEFGDVPLSDIDARVARDGLDAIRRKRGLSGTTMAETHAFFKRVMGAAVRADLIAENPLDSVKAPRRDTKPKQALDLDDLQAFLARLDAAPLDSHTMAVRIAVLGGLRRGEIVGLEWRDVSEGMLAVRRSVVERDGEVKTPKSTAGMRNVPVLPTLHDSLEEWKALQGEQLALLGLRQGGETPVITSSTGTRMRAQNLYRWWVSHREDFGVDCGLHELRHTFLTVLANSGANPQTLKSVAGWSSLEMANVYCHPDDAANTAAVGRLGDVLNSGSF